MEEIKDKIYTALRAVIDPEVGFDVVSLGLIYGVSVDEDQNATITMTLSTRSCPLHEMMIEWVRNGASSVNGVKNVQIELVWEPAWNIEMAQDHVKKALGKI